MGNMNKTFMRCFSCGAKARNLCLTAGKDICSFCCGSKRGTHINCSSDCSYYPFSIKGYDLWLKVDGGLVKKIMNYIADKRGHDYFEEVIDKMSFNSNSPDHMEGMAIGSAVYYILFIDRDKNNQTLAECWKNDGWQGLNNDERIMMNCRFSSRVTVIEIQKVSDCYSMECIDLFDSEKGAFIVLDRSIAASAVRFTRLMGWLSHYPNFSRIENNCIEVPDSIYEDFMETLQKGFRKKLKKYPEFTIKDYFSENVGDYCDYIFESARKNNIAMLNKMDFYQCKAVYKIVGSYNEIKSILDTYPDFNKRERNPEEEDLPSYCYYSWLRLGGSKTFEKKMHSCFRHDDENQGMGTIGNMILSYDKIIIEVFSKQKFKFAKEMMKKYFKENIAYQGDMVIDLAKQLAQKSINEVDDGILVEPLFAKPEKESEAVSIEFEQKITEDFYKNRYKQFLDERIPALNNWTPREAANDRTMRPTLVNLMKIHLKGIDKQNKDKNLDLNIDWVLDELNLGELKR